MLYGIDVFRLAACQWVGSRPKADIYEGSLLRAEALRQYQR